MKYFFVAVLIICIGCKTKTEVVVEEENEPAEIVMLTPAQMQNSAIDTGVVTTRSMNTTLKVNGVVDVPPQNIVSVSFPLGGYLKSTKLLPGMHVNRGEVIGIMEDPALIQLQQDYLMANARLGFLEKDFERQKMLNKEKVNADKIYQQATSEYTSQKVLVKGLSEKLRLININPGRLTESNISRSVAIYSPINGFVSKVNVNIGKYVDPSEVLFELINPADMHATLTVFEIDITLVKPNQKVEVTFVDDPGVIYHCTVLLVNRNIDENRSGLVHCHFETKPQKLLPGMFLNALIQVSDAEVLAVPEEAVVHYGAQDYIFLAVGQNTYKMLPVITGMRQTGYVEISHQPENLEGRTIVNQNAYAVLSKMMNKAEGE